MEDQASALQMDMKENTHSRNGSNVTTSETIDATIVQSQKSFEHSIESSTETSNGVNKLNDETVMDELIEENLKKKHESSNGANLPIDNAGSIDNHQDDDLIRELAQFEGEKKDDDVTINVPKATNDENGDKLQDTSDLLKDLESDSPCPGPSESEIDNLTSATEPIVSMDVDNVNKLDDTQVDSTDQLKEKSQTTADPTNDDANKVANVCDELKKTSDESNIDLEKSSNQSEVETTSDIVTTSSTSNETKNLSANEQINKTFNEEIEVSSSGNVEIVRTNDDDVPTVDTNKLDDTTEEMEQDLNVTAEMDRIVESTNSENVTKNEETTETVKNSEIDNSNKNQSIGIADDEQPKDIVANVESNEPEPMETDNQTFPQSSAKEADKQDVNGPSEDIDSVSGSAVTERIQSESTFDIRILYDSDELKSLSVVRIEKNKSEISSNTSDGSSKHTVTGMAELCKFLIDHFESKKVSLNLNGSAESLTDSLNTSTTSNKGRGRGSKKATSSVASPNQVTPKGTKRGATSKRSIDTKIDAEDGEPKAKVKKVDATGEEDEEIKGDCCMARWTDRKYYAGRVIGEKPGNKYVVLFEDGASKVMLPEVIVFGTGNVLPLLDHSVHVLVSGDTYEPGLVTKIDTDGEQVMYTVAAESTTVTCTSSNLYLMEDQAKVIHNAQKAKDGPPKTPETPSSKRTGRLPAKLEETVTSISGGRLSRGKKGQTNTSPEPGFSGDIDVKKTSRRSTKRMPPPRTRKSESSDISDLVEDENNRNSPEPALEAISGVQPELQRTPNDSELYKRTLIAEHLGNDLSRNLGDLLGPMPTNVNLFRGMHFILTCTIPIKNHKQYETKDENIGKRPFFKDYIREQIETGGGTVYLYFENIPKNKHKQCILIAQYPCLTAKYIQCLAANIKPVSHEWIIQCCIQNDLVQQTPYILPSGWSIISNNYVKWDISKSKNARNSAQPMKTTTILMASDHKEFFDFWRRVCKLAGAQTRTVKRLDDIKKSTKGFMLTDEDFCLDIKLKAEHFGVPVVSTVWAVQSLIHGNICDPDTNIQLKQPYDDGDY